ncbi:hypothetical protein ACLOJK_022994 [Asimina triloba]
MKIATTHLFFLFVACFLSIYSCDSSDISIQLNDDVLGLIVFKSGLQDPTSALASWNEDDDSPCSWAHVKCDPINSRVSHLNLDGLRLSGKIGRGLQKLYSLHSLSLSHNNFSGDVLPELALIPGLRSLNLSHNSLSGRLPTEFTNITSSIRVLDLSENSLSGPIPIQLFSNCLSLKFISLAGNSFEGPVPRTLRRCASLGSLDLSKNSLSGDPDFANVIWPLKNLRILDVSHNAFSGPVPLGIAGVHNLKQLFLQGNQFSGQLPADIGLCPHLTHFDCSDNSLIGALPSSLQWINSLEFINLSNNGFSGDFPLWIGNLSSLQWLDFARNSFSGTVPASIGDLKSLNYLSLSYNSLTGEIPQTLVYCTQLSKLKLNSNNFSGSIPPVIFNLGLEEVDLSSNSFSGSIPAGSSLLFESLRTLDMSRNELSGVIPPELGLFFNLRYLNLSWNKLRSRLPPELGYFRNLTVLDLRSCSLYGSIPEDLCDSNSLSVLQLDDNSLSGLIPEEIGNCSSLYLLTLSNNDLSGSIPRAISRLEKLKILNLEFNNLSGEIPQQLGWLDNLLAVNISYNRLVGRLPTAGIFPSLDASSLQGNLGLCSPLLKGPCKMNVPKPLVLNPDAYKHGNADNMVTGSVSARTRHRKFLSISAIFAITAAVVIVTGVVVVSLLNVSAQRRISFIDHAMDSMFSSSPRSKGPTVGRLVLFQPHNDFRNDDWSTNAEILLSKATEVGRGVFGTVYKASIGEGRMFAVKKLITSNIIQYHEDFDREIRILGNARHPNLMTVEGYYWTPQLQLLISEYAPNGSLHAKLHERSSSTPPLSWLYRFKIALGTAKGLAYLHQSFRPPIIHYNVKPSNILLDENCNPQISDFGLARLLPKLDKHVLSSRFQTSLGYVAPELACQSLRVNEKCDVYGFGVMILELVTGRKAVEYGDDDIVVLSDYVKLVLEQGNVLDCVDPSMTEYPEEEVLPVLKLGLVCTSQIPSSRPSMPEVVQILQVIKTPIPERMEAF